MAIGMVITLIIGLVAGYGGTLLTVSPATTTITKTVVAGTVTHTVTQVTTVTTTVTASIPPVTAPDFIKIGLMAPLTGPWSFIGAHLEKGAMLAVEEINNKERADIMFLQFHCNKLK